MISKKDFEDFREAHRIISRSQECLYILPHSLFRKYISNYTITFPNKDIISDGYTVLPHGCATLVFSLGNSGLNSRLFGPLTKPCQVGTHANSSYLLIIIEFQPGGLSIFSEVRQKDLTNTILPFADISSSINCKIFEMIKVAENIDDLADMLDRILLDSSLFSQPTELMAAQQIVIKSCGSAEGELISREVCYSERHLNRLFDNYLGMNIKTFSRLVRINKTLRLLQDPRRSATAVAIQSGYYDLSHFIHDFKTLCGTTLQVYRSNKSDFYSEIAKY